VSELSGAGQSSRRERSRREVSSPTRRKSPRTRPLARDASVGRCKQRARYRDRKGAGLASAVQPQPPAKRATTAGDRHRGARGSDRPRSCSWSVSIAEVDGRREAFRARRSEPSSSTIRSSSIMREHRRAKKRRKLDRGGKTARPVAGTDGPPRERASYVHSSMEVTLGRRGPRP